MSWIMEDALPPHLMIVQVAMARGVQQRLVAVVSQVITIIICQPGFSSFSFSRLFWHWHWQVEGVDEKEALARFLNCCFKTIISVWMSLQKLVFCVVCNCTSINLSSSKKDLTVQSWWKISRGYFHFLNGTFNFLFIFKMYMFVRQKTLGPKYFPWFSNLSGLCSFSPGPFCPHYY